MPSACAAGHITEFDTEELLIDLQNSRNDDVDWEVFLDGIVIELEILLNIGIVEVPVPEEWLGWESDTERSKMNHR